MDERVMALAREFRRAIEPLYGDRLKEFRVAVEPADDEGACDEGDVYLLVVLEPCQSEIAEFRRMLKLLTPLLAQHDIEALPMVFSAAAWNEGRNWLGPQGTRVAA